MKKKSSLKKIKTLNVEEVITHESLDKVKKMFEEADIDGGGGLDMNEFTTSMRKIYPNMTEKELQILYMKVIMLIIKFEILTLFDFLYKILKIDTNCNNQIDITEYLTYLLFKHQEQEHVFEMIRPKPYPKPPKEISFKSIRAEVFVAVCDSTFLRINTRVWI